MKFSAPALVLPLFCVIGCSEPVPFDSSNAVFSKVSGERAFKHVKELVGIGPRPAGSEALERSRIYLEDQLNSFGWQVKRQTFEEDTSIGKVEFGNLIARFGADQTAFSKGAKVLIASHFDTKRFSGFEFVGANDGGSSTGLLVELARVLSEKPELASQIELVLFDGEEAFGSRITAKDGLYGSRHYAKQMLLVPEKQRPSFGVLLDMVGDQDLKIRAAVQIPGQSLRDLKNQDESADPVDHEEINERLREMSRWLLDSAAELKHRSEIGISPNYIVDDHIPLNIAAGIPTIDLIDFDFPYWHTPGDTLEKVSADSLEITGKVTLHLVEKFLIRN